MDVWMQAGLKRGSELQARHPMRVLVRADVSGGLVGTRWGGVFT